ncbi:MAG: transcription termination/antitermination protein NusA [Deltaproteobacteria bacterium]|nr:transcription termination/antitermination protein NusA [Candidatus Anaeroferrophillus wilburensis]MBN2888918.1 transcription termination/antitermination protein NusA [Deltaproteobacteria bacterium]
MSSSLKFILDQVSKEKGIPKEILIEAIESAMVTASRKKLGQGRDIEASFNEESGEVELFEFVEVVENPENSYTDISLEEAREFDPDAEYGDSLGLKLDTSEFGRIAAQTAKQVIMQKIREAERESIFEEFHERIGEIVSGTVQRMERGNLIVNLGKTEAILPRAETIPRETFRQGERVRALLLDVEMTVKGPKIVLSRTHPKFLIKLFDAEVPEIFEGIITVQGAAREPGIRAKIAVFTNDHDVDPVGACVGVRGSRVQNVVQELKGEKIDIIRWNPDDVRYVCNAVSPAQISKIILDENNQAMEIIVPDDQLSLAIGRKGLNIRLAAKLTGWHLDVKSVSKVAGDFERLYESLQEVEGLDNVTMELLYDNGYRQLEDLVAASPEELEEVIGTDGADAKQLVACAQRAIEQARLAAEQQREEEQAAAEAALEVSETAGAVGNQDPVADAESGAEISAEGEADVLPAEGDER